MIPFSAMLWLVALFFGALGLRRGWKSELLSGGALILALFTILQLDGWLRNSLLRFASLAQLFALQAAVLLLVFFLTHSNLGWFSQRPASGASSRRRSLLMHSLGAALGGVNGYLLAASLWYLLDINLYPFAPMISAPSLGSPAAEAIRNLPLLGLTGGPGELLTVGIALTLVALFFKM